MATTTRAPLRHSTATEGPADDPAVEARSAQSLTWWLSRREQVARCCAAVAVYLGTTEEATEVLLLSEALRRQVSVGVVAHQLSRNTSSARGWVPAVCPACGERARLWVRGEFGLVRVLVCPAGHGVVQGPDRELVRRVEASGDGPGAGVSGSRG